jgi:glyoxylase-like metal-dependent hydrolase (beta-lactamase superfamily II)
MKKIAILFILTLTTISQAWDIGGTDYKFEQLNSQVYVMHGPLDGPSVANHGFINNPAFIEGKNGLILIDPGSSVFAGDNIINEIKTITTKPIIAVINTHVHGDHWLGNHAVKNKYPNAKFYAHMNMIREAEYGEAKRWADFYNELTAGKSTKTIPIIPGYSISHEDVLTIDGQVLVIHSPVPSSHSSSDIMIEHKNSKTLFMGDNSLVQRMGRFDGSSSMIDNIKILNYAKSLDITTVVPGHGQSGDIQTAIDSYLNYLLIIKQEVEKGYEEDLADYEIKPSADKLLSDYRDWHSYDDQLGKHIGKMLLEIEALDL